MLLRLYDNIIRFIRGYKELNNNQDLNLNEKEKRILKEISAGKSYQTIADELSESCDDIHKHIRNIYEKLQRKRMILRSK